MFTIECTDCGAKFTGKDEYSAEIKWNAHDCPSDQELDNLPFDILRELAYGRITRQEALALAHRSTLYPKGK
ncbi:MAG: hypothetical protein ACYSUV_18745 [Planctomycetota bacterium]|jgi:hypothetical protein